MLGGRGPVLSEPNKRRQAARSSQVWVLRGRHGTAYQGPSVHTGGPTPACALATCTGCISDATILRKMLLLLFLPPRHSTPPPKVRSKRDGLSWG